MSKKRRQKIILAVLLLVLVVAVWKRVGSLTSRESSGVGAAPSVSTRHSSAREDWRDELPRVEELRIGELDRVAEELDEGRNPFRIGRPEPAPSPTPSKAEIRKAKKESRKSQKIEPVAPAAPPAPTPPPVDVVFLGSFGSERMMLAVFSDGREIFNVPAGDLLKEKFVVVRIGLESADLGFVGFPDAPAQRLEIGG